MSVQIGSTALPLTFAGAQPAFTGLDQINVLLPYSLKGSGDVILKVTAAGKTANPVHISIQ